MHNYSFPSSTSSPEAREAAARAAGPEGLIRLANQLLAAHDYGAAEHERGYRLLREAAENGGGSHAQWLLGAYHLQVCSRPGARTGARDWLQAAAAAGLPMAVDRLVDLRLRGWGLPRSVPAALGLLERLADQGYARAAWELGYLRSAAEDTERDRQATDNDAFARACALGYPFAYYSLGLRFALGAGVRRDLAFARALLLRAADAGIADPRQAADELAPEEAAGSEARDWYRRLKANLDVAQPLLARLQPGLVPEAAAINTGLAAVERHFAMLGHPGIRLDGAGRLVVEDDGSPRLRAPAQAFEWRSTRPKVGMSTGFATREECAHLINLIAPRLAAPTAYQRPGDNDAGEVTHFNGSGSPIGALHTDPVVRMLEWRVAALAEWPCDAIEPSSIIRYEPGQEYKPHVDYFTEAQIRGNAVERHDFGGQRIATFLLYLRAPEEGGETYYHGAELPVRGTPGMGVIHYNVTPDGALDPASRHSGRAIVRGEKWVWRSALRARNFDHPDDATAQAVSP